MPPRGFFESLREYTSVYSLRLSKNPMLAVVARKQRYAGLREKCCGTRVRGSAPITPAGGSASCTSTFLTL